MPASLEIPDSDDETDPEDHLEDLPPRSPETRESADAVRDRLLEKFTEWNRRNDEKKSVPKCLLAQGQWLLPTCMPAWLPPPDDRFHVQKKARVFVCDTPTCRAVVRFSSTRNQTEYRRADCEFAGSFNSRDWEDLPAWLRMEAWQKRFIDATWHCTHTCSAPTTLNDFQKNKRR